MKKADLTIIISVKNEEDYIGPTIKSLLDQTYSNFELWVIDDGSTDRTWQVIRSFKDKRIKSWHFDTNAGMTARLNWIMPQVKTEFIARMDSHNLADKTRLEKQHRYMLAHPETVALGSNFTRQTEAGKILLRTSFPTDPRTIRRNLMEKNLFKHASMFFRRAVYDQVGYYDTYFRVAQDYDFMLRVVSRFPAANLDESLVTETYRQSNLTQKHRVRSAWEALTAQWNGLTRYSYPLWQSIFLLRGMAYLAKSAVFQLTK